MRTDEEHPSGLDCPSARDALSLRLDGELNPLDRGRALTVHLASCAKCRAYEDVLAGLATEFDGLRRGEPPHDLLARIERRARSRRGVSRWTARVAAGFIGFLGLGGAMLLLERGFPTSAPERHFFERLSVATNTHDSAFFGAVPEYQLLRRFSPDVEEPR